MSPVCTPHTIVVQVWAERFEKKPVCGPAGQLYQLAEQAASSQQKVANTE